MKKRTLRVVAALITLIMLVQVIPLSVFAAENTESSETMELSVSSMNGIPGGTVQVTVNLKNNPGIASLAFNVEYDDALTLTNVEFNSVFGSYITTPKPYTNPQTITLISPLNDASAEGTLATLTFHISEEALDEYVAKINITYNANDVYNGNYDNIALSVVNGSVTVYHGIPGDIDGDSKVNTKDAILLFRYVAGWDVDVDPAALDVNGDNKVDTKDAVALFRYIAGWDGIVLYRGKTCAHTLTAIPAKAATCTEDGNIAYWTCSLCGAYFSDAAGKNEIKLSDTVSEVKKGHAPVIDEAVAPTYEKTGLTEGSHCSTCGTVLVAQQAVSKLEPSYYSITYRNLQGAKIPEEYLTYVDHLGMTLPDENIIKVDGYKFLGWYTEENGNGKRVYKIEAGSSENIEVHGYWEVITYQIIYTGVPSDFDNGIHEYTIESGNIYLNTNPEWKHLIFTGWEDQSGELSYNKIGIPMIKEGTTGDIFLKATWKTRQNIFDKAEKQYSNSAYNEEDGKYYFFYHLGDLSNVLLQSKEGNGKDHTGVETTITTTQTVKVSKDYAEGYATAISQATTKTFEATLSSEVIASLLTTVGASATVGAEVGPKFAKANASATASTEVSVGASWSAAVGTSSSTSSATSETNEVTTTMSFMEESSFTEAESKTLTADDPRGKYYFLAAGTFEIYSVVVYDPIKNELQFTIYSNHIDTYPMILYYPDATDVKVNTEFDEIQYDVYEDDIAKTITNSLFVFYETGHSDVVVDKNARSNDVFELNDQGNLPTSDFYSRYGYDFDGWELRDANGNLLVDKINDGEEIALLAQYAKDYDCRVFKLIARWKVKSIIKITLNDQVADTPANFREVYIHVGKGVFADYEGQTPLIGIMPPSKIGYVFSGYYVEVNNNTFTDAVGTTCIINPDGTFSDYLRNSGYSHFEDNATIKALWTRATYKITLNFEGGNAGTEYFYSKYKTGVYTDSECTTPITDNRIAIPKKDGFGFVGYYDQNGNLLVDGSGNVDDRFLGEYDEIISDISLSARWEENAYTVQWNTATGCSISVERTSSPDVGAATGKLTSGSVVYYGDVLKITYTNSTGYTVTAHGETSVHVTGNVTASTIYANVTANTYTIEYRANGGSGTTASSTHTYDQSKALSTNGFIRLGWTFAGWNTESSGSGTWYSENETVKNLTSVNGAVRVLYAVWKPEIHTVTNYEKINTENYKVAGSGKKFTKEIPTEKSFLELYESGYRKILISVYYDIMEVDDCYQTIRLRSSDTTYYETTFSHGGFEKYTSILGIFGATSYGDQWWGTYCLSVEIDLENLLGNKLFFEAQAENATFRDFLVGGVYVTAKVSPTSMK